MGTQDQDAELRYYTEIMDFFETTDSDPEKLEIWRSMQLIKLMDDLAHNRKSAEVVINSIIIINALLEDFPDDTIYSRGEESFDKLSLSEKNQLKKELERELLIA